MTTRRVLFLVPFILASILTAAMHPRIAAAENQNGYYDIEGSARWCANGVTNCSYESGNSWKLYISIDGLDNGLPSGTPFYLGLGCRHAYDAGGVRVNDESFIDAIIYNGEISGTARIYGNDLNEDPNSAQWAILSNLTGVAPERNYGFEVTGRVFGPALINSYANKRISGGFRVTLSPYVHEILNPDGSVASHTVVYGTLSCSSPNNNFTQSVDYDASFDNEANVPDPGDEPN